MKERSIISYLDFYSISKHAMFEAFRKNEMRRKKKKRKKKKRKEKKKKHKPC